MYLFVCNLAKYLDDPDGVLWSFWLSGWQRCLGRSRVRCQI